MKKGSKKSKKKVMVATQSVNDESSLDDDNYKVTNLCFMAHKDQLTSKNICDFTFNELQEAFNNLLGNLKEVRPQE